MTKFPPFFQRRSSCCSASLRDAHGCIHLQQKCFCTLSLQGPLTDSNERPRREWHLCVFPSQTGCSPGGRRSDYDVLAEPRYGLWAQGHSLVKKIFKVMKTFQCNQWRSCAFLLVIDSKHLGGERECLRVGTSYILEFLSDRLSERLVFPPRRYYLAKDYI